LVQEMIDFQIDVRKDFLSALNYVEMDRARTVLDWLAKLPAASPEEVALGDRLGAIRVEKIARQLPQNTAAVEYSLGNKSLRVWVVRREKVDFRDLAVDPRSFGRLCDGLRRSIISDSRKDFLNISASLYDLVIRPVESMLPPEGTLVFIPDGCLSSVPFSALFDRSSGRYLFEKWTSSKAPSINVYFKSIFRRRGIEYEKGPRALVVGDPAFDRSLFHTLSRLPHAAEEAASVAAILKNSELIEGSEATKSQFLSHAAGKQMVHFAGHAILNAKNPLLSALLLAPERRSGDDGVLFVRDIAAHHLLDTNLVVLAACSTASGPTFRTQDALSLAEPFLAAGVPAVIASLWDVDDKASAAFWEQFYSHLTQEGDAAKALRMTREDMLGNRTSFTASPWVWAAFEIIGGVRSGKYTPTPAGDLDN